MNTIHTYRDLTVWQKSMNLVVLIYELTEKFPQEEIYGLTSQIRRSAVSIPSNIAEGRQRGSKRDFLRFLRIAQASASELETQIEIAKQLPNTSKIDYAEAESLLTEVLKMLYVMLRNMKSAHKKASVANVAPVASTTS